MDIKYIKSALLCIFLFLFSTLSFAQESAKGIYLTQYTFENTTYLNYLIKNAKAVGINTFVVDYEFPSKRYRNNIALLKENNIQYVARIVMFPDGGTRAQIKSPEYWQRKYSLVKTAVDMGASQIQLDYIRYSSKTPPSSQNAKDIHEIIKWYKTKLAAQGIPLQIDVFGVTSFGESKHIGQNLKLFSESIDAICPMVYPSHYEPFNYHFKRPYETVYDSLTRIQDQFGDDMPIKMYAYIELSNYHYRMSGEKRIEYIKAQLNAVKNAGADGWYAWSPHNRYEYLFKALGGQPKAKNENENENENKTLSQN
ncbi:MAG: hypothetical protein ACD_46C00619G0012 [uncultured bacterium]|nr:MAG: hypothetical protein ACD_46C00619G0012 [uncultured bacterium]